MKNRRLALTLTFTPCIRRGEEINDKTTPEELKLMLYDLAATLTSDKFCEDIAIWQTMQGNIDEDELQEDSIDKLDRAIIHQMNVDQAKTILNSRQTVEAMLLVFSSISAGTSPGVDVVRNDESE